jgi:hypothetical protein
MRESERVETSVPDSFESNIHIIFSAGSICVMLLPD